FLLTIRFSYYSLHTCANPLHIYIFRSTTTFFAPYPHNFAQLPYFPLQIHTISLDPHIFRSISIQFRSTPIFFAPNPYNSARPSYFPLHIHTFSLNTHIFRSISIQFPSSLIFAAPYPYNFAQLPYFSLHILDTVPIE